MINDKYVLFSDLDNTLYNWVDYYAPCFRSMVHVLKRKTNLNEDELIESFRKVFIKYNSIEYPFVVQELDIWQKLGWSDGDILQNAVHPARVAFGRTRNKRLYLYPNVRETLKWLKDEGVIIFAYSNAPTHQAMIRLKLLRITSYIDHLVIFREMPRPKIAEKDVLDRFEKNYSDTGINLLIHDSSMMKPDPKPVIDIINKYHISINLMFLVGDSINMDISIANAIGIKGIWARYGEIAEKKNIETIKKISTINNKNRTRTDFSEVEPDYVIDNFSELIDIFKKYKTHQLSLGF